MSAKRRSENQCQYVTASGRKCRMFRAQGHPSLCLHHSEQEQRRQNAAALAEMTASAEDFSSASAINRFLGNLLKLMARGEIPRRDAAVLGYLCQLLLNTLPALRTEALSGEQSSGEESAFDRANLPTHLKTFVPDIPRPLRAITNDGTAS